MKIHFTGMGGIGMSALASVTLDKGYDVSGSDIRMNKRLEELRMRGATLFLTQSESNIADTVDLLVYTSAVSMDNPEIKKAINLGIPCVRRGDYLPELFDDKYCIVVAGSHGKTTVTSMIAHMLIDLEGIGNASYYIGGVLPGTGKNGFYGAGNHAAVELDESDRSFLSFRKGTGCITNIELEHVDQYGNEAAYFEAYGRFAEQFNGPLYVGSNCVSAVKKYNEDVKSVGLKTGDIVPSEYWDDGFIYKGERVDLLKKGEYHVFDAFMAYTAVCSLRYNPHKAAKALGSYSGVKRRMETVYDNGRIRLIDDYAHHPSEVAASYDSVENDKKTMLIFQPHRYSRFNTFFDEFVTVLTETADTLVIMPVYAASEIKGEADRDGKDLYDQLVNRRESLYFAEDLDSAADTVWELLDKHDVCLTMGAGDVNRILDEIRRRLDE